MKYEITFNKTYAHSCNLIQKTIKGSQLYIDRIDDIVLIDNIKIADLQEINQIRFLVHGYYQTIDVADPHTKIEATNIEMKGSEQYAKV